MNTWSPTSARQQLRASIVVLIFGGLILLAAAAFAWQARSRAVLRDAGEVATAHVTFATPAGKGRHQLRYEFDTGGRVWAGETWTSGANDPAWDGTQTQSIKVRFLADDPATNAWEPTLARDVRKNTILAFVFGLMAAIALGIGVYARRESQGWATTLDT